MHENKAPSNFVVSFLSSCTSALFAIIHSKKEEISDTVIGGTLYIDILCNNIRTSAPVS